MDHSELAKTFVYEMMSLRDCLKVNLTNLKVEGTIHWIPTDIFYSLSSIYIYNTNRYIQYTVITVVEN